MEVSIRHLRKLLNETESVHKSDIIDYARGHLNENQLLKKDVTYKKHRPWETANIPPIKHKQKSKIAKQNDLSIQNEMTNVLYQFTAGTSVPFKFLKGDNITKIYNEKNGGRSESLLSVINDDVLIEEFVAKPSLNLPPIDSTIHAYSAHQHPYKPEDDAKAAGEVLRTPTPIENETSETDIKYDTSRYSHLLVNPELQDILKLRNDVAVPGSIHGATKRDQFINRHKFVKHVVKPKDYSDQASKSGRVMVSHLEEDLEKQLKTIAFKCEGPSKEKLLVYQDTLDKLIKGSPTFNRILSTIKDEYDEYLTYLLSKLNATSHHELVQAQVHQMVAGGTSRPYEMEQARLRLEKLESRAEEVLNENQRLREDLRNETSTESYQVTLEKKESHSGRQKTTDIEHVKAMILEKLDQIDDLKNRMKSNCVPTTVCSHIENCIKETEVEVQKLLKQNEYFEQSIAENEKLLKEAILDADTSDREERRIWRWINFPTGLGSDKYFSVDCSDSEDEETKWGWYIS